MNGCAQGQKMNRNEKQGYLPGNAEYTNDRVFIESLDMRLSGLENFE